MVANVRIIDNFLGDAANDVAEIVGGPGEISRNFVTIDGVVGYVLGTDAATIVRIESNSVRVLDGGVVTGAVIRAWAGQAHNVIANNIVVLESGATQLPRWRGSP